MAKTYRLIQSNLPGFTGVANLYTVSEPVTYYDSDSEEERTTGYVIVSATVVQYSGPETYAFPANAEGEVVSWSELDGSRKGTLDHNEILNNMGYTPDKN